MNSSPIDRLILLVLSDSQSGPLMQQLSQNDFRFTVVNSTGSLVQEASICLMIGFSHERLSLLMEIIRENCKVYRRFIPTQGVVLPEQLTGPMVEAQMGGAALYMLNVERFEQI